MRTEKVVEVINGVKAVQGSSAMNPVVAGTHVLTNNPPVIHETKIVLAATTFAVASAALAFGTKLFTFPVGKIIVHKCIAELSFVADGANSVAADIGLGTLLASGAQTALSGVGATAEDIMDGFTATVLNGKTAVTQTVIQDGINDEKDGSVTAKACHLNIAGNWNVSTNVVYSGTITVLWSNLND